jgi:hypothetical protein
MEKFIPISKFIGEPPDILERLSREPIEEKKDMPPINFDSIPLTDVYKKTQEAKSQNKKSTEK